MRLLVTTPHYPPESGGPATYAKLLADHFPAFGVAVEVIPFEKVRRYPKLLRPLLYLLLILRKAREADVILALDPVSSGVPAAVAAMLFDKPLVAKIVGDRAWERGRERYGVTQSLDEFVRVRKVALPLRATRRAQAWVAKRASRVIVPSNYLKQIVATWGVAKDKIEIVYNSVEQRQAGSVPEAVAALDGFRIVAVARLVRWKHVDLIIAALAQLPAANLIVVGDGPERSRLEELAKGERRIIFTGEISNQDTLAIVKAADVLVLNSSYEGMSHVLIEALTQAVPIVATRAGGNEEVLKDGSGILVPVGDTAALAGALRRLQDDPALRDKLRKAAAERAKAFSVVTMLERTKAILMSVQTHG